MPGCAQQPPACDQPGQEGKHARCGCDTSGHHSSRSNCLTVPGRDVPFAAPELVLARRSSLIISVTSVPPAKEPIRSPNTETQREPGGCVPGGHFFG